jgi:uncharacterized protein YbjT (DUF2867 family)
MRVLVLGATGVVAAPILQRLLDGGDEVVGVSRDTETAARRLPAVRWVARDIARLTQPQDWAPLLDGIDAVVNAAGVLQDSLRDDVTALQLTSMTALYAACVAHGVRKVVQISAAGASVNAPSVFMRTKGEADDALAALDLDWVVFRPGVVLGPSAVGASAMMRALAALPVAIPLANPEMRIRTVHADDVADAVMLALADGIPLRQVYDLVEPQSHTLKEVVSAFRAWMGYRPARIFALPSWAATALFRIGDGLGWLGWRTPMRSTAQQQMQVGIAGDPAPWTAAVRELPGLEASLRRIPATLQERWFARVWMVKPLAVAALSIFWIATGVIALARPDVSMAIVAIRGTPLWIAAFMVIAGGISDILLGLALLVRRWLVPTCLVMIAVSILYMIVGTIVAPDYWIDPLGPFLKVLSVIALTLVLLATAEDR